MADNVGITPGSGDKAASRSVTYSGETAQVQIVGLSVVSGPDDAKTVEDVSAAAPLPVRMDQGPGALVTENGALRVDPTQVNEQAQEVLNATGLHSFGDEPLQMVGLHPSFPLPIDTATPMPIAGRDPTGAQRQIATDGNGAMLPSNETKTLSLRRVFPTSTPGVLAVVDCAGFESVIAVQLSGFSGCPIIFSWSMDNTNFFTATGIDYTSSSPAYIYANNIITVTGLYAFPVIARYLRISVNAVSSTTTVNWELHLRRNPLTLGALIPNHGFNLSQINGSAISATTAQLGVNAFGPTAPNAAHSTNAPVQISGSDGTNVRRILTDVAGNTQVVGGLVAGASALLSTTGVRPVQKGVLDAEGRVRHVVGTPRGQINVRQDDATTKSEAGVIDALNDVVRELKLLNARIADLPYWLGVGAAMPDDASTFRDDPYIFNQ